LVTGRVKPINWILLNVTPAVHRLRLHLVA
jgi:hypothetical protein